MPMTWLYTQNTQELIRKSNKCLGYRINTQKTNTFLYTKNEHMESENLKSTVLFIIVSMAKKSINKSNKYMYNIYTLKITK
jgi:hypothetical protein